MEQSEAKMSSEWRKSMLEDNDWMSKLKCVCSLCGCGAHTCSKLDLSNIVSAVEHNRCDKMEDKEWSESDDGCACLDQLEQRYLSDSCKSERMSGERELLRVLVTRPEIAAKPRDNILFEGDMDLKTTFETSYEALAKMRLDQWKQQQQQTSGKTRPKRNRRPKKQEETKGKPEVSVKARKPKVKEHPEGGELPKSSEPLEGEVWQAKNKLAAADLTEAPQEMALNLPNDYIDPDLSSIIVYDANMNRLEKVGLRKRSKYRPSTSLRSGSRGLFGDGAVDESNKADKHQAIMRDTSTQTPVQSELETQLVTDNLETDKKHKNEPSQNARNLNDSNQSNYFTFSNKNLPIDSKRKVRDNINMRDHIREQNIVETSRQREINVVQKKAFEEEQNEFLLSVENLELAKQEEADAVEEIQKLIQEESSFEKIETEVIKEVEVDSSRRNDSRARSSKQQRTCQNQSFNLFDNNYPENKIDEFKKDISYVTSSRVSPQSRISTNLFRESPDFILTTGQLAEQNYEDLKGSQIAKVNNHQFNEMNSQISNIPNEIVNAKLERKITNENGSNSPNECKVLSLNENFQYVGTQSGHKYFVEKH